MTSRRAARRQSDQRYLINSPMLPQLKRDANGG